MTGYSIYRTVIGYYSGEENAYDMRKVGLVSFFSSSFFSFLPSVLGPSYSDRRYYSSEENAYDMRKVDLVRDIPCNPKP